jgi:hypothetical protein
LVPPGEAFASPGTCAERLAREAVATAERTDSLNFQGDALVDLPEALQVAGKDEDAVATLEQAVERYGRKRNLVMADRVRARLAKVQLSDAAAERA